MEKFHFWMTKAIAYSTFGAHSADGISALMVRLGYSSVRLYCTFIPVKCTNKSSVSSNNIQSCLRNYPRPFTVIFIRSLSRTFHLTE